VKQDDLYNRATATYGRALERLAYAYEVVPDRRKDLLQEIHVALWRSFKTFEDRCSVRTWVYRIAHNAAAAYITMQRRVKASELVSLDELESMPDPSAGPSLTDKRIDAGKLLELIHRLKPVDRQLMLLYLEDLEADTIGEIMGISTNNVRVQVHRIKKVLARRFHAGGDER
jgi:RNA polymerase sigma-70 factor (ECF subfamily)